MALVHICLVLALALGVHGLPGRVPKVYNALITSGQNLAPSKSFPIYQPVYRDAYGFPLSTFYYDDDFKSFFSDSGLQPHQLGAAAQGLASGSDIPSRPAAESAPSDDAGRSQSADGAPVLPTPPGGIPQEERSPAAADPQPPGGQPPPPPATRAPIPLNEFGLPPAIVPLGAHRNQPRPAPAFSFDPFAHFSPYYPQLNPYADPYSFQSYPLLPPLYRFNGEALPEPAEPAKPADPAKPAEPAKPVEPTRAAAPSPAPPSAPADLDLNNYSGKDHSIPDVPPPPLPGGGLKRDNAQTN